MACTVSIISDYEGVEKLRPVWQKWQTHPNSDLDHYLLVCKLRKEVLSPLIAVVHADGEPRCLAVGRVEKATFKPTFGYLTPVKIPARSVSIINQGLMGDLIPEYAEAIVEALQTHLKKGGADFVVFHQLHENSTFLSAARARASRVLLEVPRAWPAHWALAMKPEPGFLVKAMRSKHRSWIKKKTQELETKYPGAVSWEWKTEFNDLPEFCEAIEQVAALAYQRGLGAGFYNDEEHRSRYSLFARRGMLRACVLRLEGKPAGFWIGTVYNGVFHSSVTGFNPNLRDLEIGTQIFLQTVDNLAREGVTEFDFGLGDASYKQRFGDKTWKECTVHLFAPSIKGLALRSVTGFFDFADHNARRVLSAMGGIDKVKTKWRRLVERPNAANAKSVKQQPVEQTADNV